MGRDWGIHRSIRLDLFLVLLGFVLVSCSGKSTPTKLILPSHEPTDTPSLIPTPISPNTQTPSLTENPYDDVLSRCIVLPGIDPLLSPDGKWLEASCEGGNESHLRIARLDGTYAIEMTFEELTGLAPWLTYTDENGWEGGFPGILPIVHWSKDSRFVYISPTYVADGLGLGGFYLFRIEVPGGEVKIILPGNGAFYFLTLSPDDILLIYSQFDNPSLHFVNLITGETTLYGSNKYPAESFLWSPDGSSFLFTTGDLWSEEETSLHIFEMGTMTTRVLLKDQRRFVPEAWVSGSEVILVSYLDGSKYILNLESMEITDWVMVATPTP